jgi:site-specific DNA recombinase
VEANNSFFELLQEVSSNEKALGSFEKIMKSQYSQSNKEKSAEVSKMKQELEVSRTRLNNAQIMMLDGKLDANDYANIKSRLEPEMQKIASRLALLDTKNPEESKIIDYGFYFLRNLDKLFAVADLEKKHRILGSTCPEKLFFENGGVRTATDDGIIPILLSGIISSTKNKEARSKNFDLASCRVGVDGIEPPTLCL